MKFTLDNVIGPKTLERRRAVVLMTDGLDDSTITFAELLEQVQQTDTLIVPTYIDNELSSPVPAPSRVYENARRVLNLLAQESGGSYYHARKLSDLNGVYAQVINDLGKIYSLGYKPANATRDRRWRRVQVSIVNQTDLTARTRPGYYAQ